MDLAFTRPYRFLKWRQQKLFLFTGKGRKRSFTHPWKLSAALLALEPKVQWGLTCGHVSSAEIAKNMPRILIVFCSWESEWESQSHWLIQQVKVDSLVVVTAITAKLASIQTSTCSSCSGNLTSGFSDMALMREKSQPEASKPSSLKPVSTTNKEGGGGGDCVWLPICTWTHHSGSWQPCTSPHLWVILHKASGILSRKILSSVVVAVAFPKVFHFTQLAS